MFICISSKCFAYASVNFFALFIIPHYSYASTGYFLAPTLMTSLSCSCAQGEACISIPGKVPWTNRWCCLRSRSLDIYPLAGQPCSNSGNSFLTNELSPSRAPNTWPLLSLSLEPGQVELGLAGDKRHKAAVRLAMPKQSATALLFDVPDKLHMGAWIRGFIQALGIIPPADTMEVKPDATYSGN